eukprot:g258.t1
MKRTPVTNRHVEKHMQMRFDRMHRARMKRTKPTIDLTLASNIQRRFNAKKALMDKERRLEIVRMNEKLNKKLSSMTSIRASEQTVSGCKFRSKLEARMKARAIRVNAANRELSERLKKVKAFVSNRRKKKRRLPLTSALSSSAQAFAVRSAWGRQLMSAVSRSPTRQFLSMLRKTDRTCCLPRSPRRPTTCGSSPTKVRWDLGGSGYLFSSCVRRSHLVDLSLSDDLMIEVAKRVHISGPSGEITDRSSSRWWSVYVFDIASNRDHMTKGVSIRAIPIVGTHGDAAAPEANIVFVPLCKVIDLCSSESEALRDALKMFDVTESASSSDLSKCPGRLSGALEGSLRGSFMSSLLQRLRFFRGRIWLEGTDAWSRAQSRENRMTARAARDRMRYCEKRERARTAKLAKVQRRARVVDASSSFRERPRTVGSTPSKRIPRGLGGGPRIRQKVERLRASLGTITRSIESMQRALADARKSHDSADERVRKIKEFGHALKCMSMSATRSDLKTATCIHQSLTNVESANERLKVVVPKLAEHVREIVRAIDVSTETHAKLTKRLNRSARYCDEDAFAAAARASEEGASVASTLRDSVSSIGIEIEEIANGAKEAVARATKAHHEANTKRRAAVRIQAVQRGKMNRSKFKKQKSAATTIQSLHRGRLSRAELRRKRASAVRVQSMCRGYAQRRTLDRRRAAATKIQSLHRGSRVRKTMSSMPHTCLYRGAAKVGGTHLLLRIQKDPRTVGTAVLIATRSESGQTDRVAVTDSDVRRVLGALDDAVRLRNIFEGLFTKHARGS